MSDRTPIAVFDGHNDALLRLYGGGIEGAAERFLAGTADGHLDAPRARTGGLAGGLFAIFPAAVERRPPEADGRERAPRLPLAAEIDFDVALASTVAMAAILFRIERAAAGAFTVCRNTSDIRSAMARGALAAVFHVEGAEAIPADLGMLDLLHAAGLRSLGPVWSRPNIFGHGVPFRFPSSPDIGPGLTDAGKALVAACNERRILIDLSHLNERGFRDIAALSTAPLVASHSNVHAISPHSRNLTAWQLAAIRDTGGLVGLNFATGFLRSDGQMNAETGLDIMVDHIDALLEVLGPDGVGLGSDFDGALIPREIGDVAGLPRLLDAMLARGYGRDLVEKIAWRNWVDVLDRTIG